MRLRARGKAVIQNQSEEMELINVNMVIVNSLRGKDAQEQIS